MDHTEEKQTQKKRKKSGIGTWIYRVVILALICVMGYSGFNIYKIYDEYEEGKIIYDDLADQVGAGKKTGTDNTHLHVDWNLLKEKNKDVCGWIRCQDTVLNYPMVWGKNWDNRDEYHNYYLDYTITGEWNGKGTILVDHLCENPFEDFLTITYGHRMKDGSMYKMFVNYFGSDGPDYLAEHPIVELYTEKESFDVYIFACAQVSSFDGDIYRFDFKNSAGKDDPKEKQAYIDNIFRVNQLQTDPGITVTPDDRIIMMSTCTSALDTNRDVVWGKMVPVD